MASLTPMQRELRRISRYEAKLQKQGYMGRVPDWLKPTTLEEAKEVTPKRIREHYYQYDPITDEHVTVNEARRRAREAQRQHPETMPSEAIDESIIEAILERIRALPSYRWTHEGQFMIEGRKDALEGALYDMLNEADNAGPEAYADYIRYLHSVEEQLAPVLEPISHSSDQEEITQAFTNATVLIRNRALTMSEAIDIEETVNAYYTEGSDYE